MTSCVDIREDLKAYADGELPGAELARVRLHVDACTRCTRDLEEIRSLSRTLRSLDTAVPPPELRARILSEIPAPERIPSPARLPWWRMPALGLGTAAAALLIFVAVGPRAHKMPEDLAAAREEATPAPQAPAAAATPGTESETLKSPASKPKSIPPAKATDPKSRVPLLSNSSASNARIKSPVDGRVTPLDTARVALPEMTAPRAAEVLRKEKSDAPALRPAQPSEVKAQLYVEAGKTDAISATPAPSAASVGAARNAPAPPQGPPGGGALGGLGAPAGMAADSTLAENQQSRRAPAQMPQNMMYNMALDSIRTEVLEVQQPDVEGVANGIIAAAQDEGGKPVAPEKRADPGASDVVLTLLVPASKVDEIKALFTEAKLDRYSRAGKTQNQSFGATRARELGVKGNLENRAYFGYLAPVEKQVNESMTTRNLGSGGRDNLQLRQQADRQATVREQDAAKMAKPSSGGFRSTAGRLNTRGAEPASRPQNKKAAEEMVRLIVKVRTPTKQAPATKRGDE